MPEDVSAALRAQKLLRSAGPHAPATVRRRLAGWSVLTRWRGPFWRDQHRPGFRKIDQ